ncbi:hypothetical protein HKX48_006929 [Thoreauomyces humboldtii]|nr:hypothetical protein HKX48_006929 [Thoreauomyces humboldtii]
MLVKCDGRTVRLVGKVLGVNSNEALVEASDLGQVTVRLIPGSIVERSTGSIVEVLGRVQGNQAMQEAASTALGDSWNPENYNRMLGLASDFDELFGWF